MARYGCTRLVVDGLTLERPAMLAVPSSKREELPLEPEPMTPEQFAELSPEAQERLVSNGLRGGR